MIPMEEKQPSNVVIDGTLKPGGAQPIQESSSGSTGKMIAIEDLHKFTRGKKPGSDLPANLQRRGKEIIH